MEMIKDEDQLYENKLAILPYYENGICHICNSPIEYHDKILVTTIRDTEKWTVFVPLTMLKCPWCEARIKSILIWKDLEVTSEFETIGKEK